MLSSMSRVVRLGLQPIALDLSARQRTFVPKLSDCCKGEDQTFWTTQLGDATHTVEVPLELFLRERRRRGGPCQPHPVELLPHPFGDVVHRVLTVFSEVVSFPSMSNILA